MKKLADLSEAELDELISNYLNVEDIKDFDIDYLENNYSFMTRAIMKSNDKNLYELCSDELKGDLAFVEFLITKFKDDLFYVDNVLMEYFNRCSEQEKLNYKNITFLINNLKDKSKKCIVADYFINNSDDEVLKLEMMLIFFNDRDNFFEYAIKANNEIFATMVEVEFGVKSIQDPEQKKLVGLGFGVIRERYKTSEIVINEFAARYLYKIFYKKDFNIEKFLHQSFSSKSAVLKYGLNAFIGDYLKSLDSFLAEYVLIRPELLKTIMNDFNYALSRWDIFFEKNNKDRISIIYEEAEKYLDKNDSGISFSYSEAVYYFAKKRGIARLFDEYNKKLLGEDLECFYEAPLLDFMLENNKDFNLPELKYLKFLESLFDKLFNERVVEEVDDYIIEDAKAGQIFDFVSTPSKK